jgi:hypothetical protein
MKEEALKLADELEALHQYVPSEAPAMIRRLVEELDKKPLSDEEILNSWVGIDLPEECWITDEQLINFAKAIEEKHGIK